MEKEELSALTSASDPAEALQDIGGLPALAAGLGVDIRAGINEEEVKLRQAMYGVNRLPETPPTSLWEHFMDSLDDRDLKILIVAAISSVLFGVFVTADMDDAIQGCAIMSAVVIVSLVSTVQNYRQEVGFQSLQRVSIMGLLVQIPSFSNVVGLLVVQTSCCCSCHS